MKVPVIDKFHVNGGFLVKETVCSDSAQGIRNEVIERIALMYYVDFYSLFNNSEKD